MLRELLSENSDVSTLRLMSIISLLCGCSIAVYGIYMGRDLMGLAVLCGVFVTAAFGGKVSQKLIENKNKTE